MAGFENLSASQSIVSRQLIAFHRREQMAKLVASTDPTLPEPSTVARARNFYLVVNADFTTSTPPFKVTGLPRNDDDDD